MSNPRTGNTSSGFPRTSTTSVPFQTPIEEVRYSLPEILMELQAERTEGSFAMEKLSQVEIDKLFKTRGRHAKSKK